MHHLLQITLAIRRHPLCRSRIPHDMVMAVVLLHPKYLPIPPQAPIPPSSWHHLVTGRHRIQGPHPILMLCPKVESL